MAGPGAHGVPGDPGAADGGALSYAGAGVDIAAGDRAVDLIRDAVARATRPEVVGGIGGFAGLFDASRLAAYRRPLLATATDGVGTKVAIAQQLGVYGTVGIDLVAMVVDDLAVCGAEPLFLTDYVVCGRIRPERVAAIVAGVAEGCVQAGCALIGGETAEHPGHLWPGRLRPGGSGNRGGRGGPAARTRPGPARRRGDRDGLVWPALERVFAGPAGAECQAGRGGRSTSARRRQG